MTTLQQSVYQSIVEYPRSIYDLVRSIALFVPDDHELSASVKDCLDSLCYAPPEQHGMHLRLLCDSFNEAFPEDEVLTSPWWFRVVCILLTGGNDASAELFRSM